MKVDWASAYKQISVHLEDVDLQWFQLMEKYFCELSLIFESVSSVGIFDRLAKLILHFFTVRSEFPPIMVSHARRDASMVYTTTQSNRLGG